MSRSVGGKPPVVESQMKIDRSVAKSAAAQFAERRVGDGYFLDACALCKAKIHESQDRYMYGYLQAFCSIGCRDDQIALDEMVKPPSPLRRPNVACSIRGLNNSKPKKSRP